MKTQQPFINNNNTYWYVKERSVMIPHKNLRLYCKDSRHMVNVYGKGIFNGNFCLASDTLIWPMRMINFRSAFSFLYKYIRVTSLLTCFYVKTIEHNPKKKLTKWIKFKFIIFPTALLCLYMCCKSIQQRSGLLPCSSG